MDKCPKWAKSSNTDSWTCFRERTIELPEVDEDSGHTVVHYLHTGAYQTLKLQNVSHDAKNLAKYTRDMRLYCVTKQCGLASLEELSKQYAETHSQGISFIQMLEVAEKVFKKFPDDEVWFTDCLKKKMRTAFEADKFVFTKDNFLDRIGKVKNLDRTLVKCIAELYAEKHSHTEEPSCLIEASSLPKEDLPRAENVDEVGKPADIEVPLVETSNFTFGSWGNPKANALLFQKAAMHTLSTLTPPPATSPLRGAAPREEISEIASANSFSIEAPKVDEICEPKQEPEPKEDSWGSFTSNKKKSKKKGVKKSLWFDEEVKAVSLVPEVPPPGDCPPAPPDKPQLDVSVVDKDPVEICPWRATHLQQDKLWKKCFSCRAFIEGVARRSTMLEF